MHKERLMRKEHPMNDRDVNLVRYDLGGGRQWPGVDDVDRQGYHGIEWVLRYGQPTYADLLSAASIVAAYETLMRGLDTPGAVRALLDLRHAAHTRVQ